MSRFIKVMLILVALHVACLSAAQAKLSDLDQQLVDLVRRLAENPHLMDPRYLSTVLGTPEVKWEAGATANQAYEWCDPRSQETLYKLEQRTDRDSNHTDSIFTLFPPVTSKIDFKGLEELLGKSLGTSYDQQINQVKTFSISDKTQIAALLPSGTFAVKQVSITYKGGQLQEPSQEEHDAAIADRRAKAFEYTKQKQYDKALPLLQSHMQVRPADAEARVALADTYKNCFYLNDAIDQYKMAYKQAANDRDLRQRCLDGLKELRVIPRAPGEKSGQSTASSQNNDTNWLSNLFGKKPTSQTGTNPPAPQPANTRGFGVASKADPLDPGF